MRCSLIAVFNDAPVKKIFLLSVIPALLTLSCNVRDREKEESPTVEAAEADRASATGKPAIDVHDPNSLVGQMLDDVKPTLDAAEIRYRIIEQDGEAMIMTMDYLPERLNLKVKNGAIIEISKG